MGTIYRFISDPSLPNPVAEWFRILDDAPEEIKAERGVWLYFRSMGPLAKTADGSIDVKRSPLASLFPPTVRRGILWTVGEMHFLSTPLRATYPRLHAVSTSLKKWLETFECIYSNSPGHHNEWNYYLEGSVKNYDPPVYALAGGLEALRSGRYFVSDGDNDFILDKLCSTLRLRDVHCKQEA
jgi:hypothetical protein